MITNQIQFEQEVPIRSVVLSAEDFPKVDRARFKNLLVYPASASNEELESFMEFAAGRACVKVKGVSAPHETGESHVDHT